MGAGDTVVDVTDELARLASRYRADQRTHADGSPWVVLNMIASIDGAISVDGLSGGLGNTADLAVFKTLRSLADVVLVAAGTARAEGYRPPKINPAAATDRANRGQAERPVIGVVTRSLRLDLDSELFATSSYRPTVVTVSDADPDRLAEVSERADVVLAGTGDVDLANAIAQLGERSGPMILAEGGPTLNGQLGAVDALDELCLTLAPLLVGTDAARILAHGPHHPARQFELDRAVAAGGLLFTRYLRTR